MSALNAVAPENMYPMCVTFHAENMYSMSVTDMRLRLTCRIVAEAGIDTDFRSYVNYEPRVAPSNMAYMAFHVTELVSHMFQRSHPRDVPPEIPR